MTTKDTTGSKLISSMRRTKAAVDGEAEKPAVPTKAATKPAPDRKPAAKPATKTAARPAPKPAAQATAKPAAADPFQSRRRVWPD
ncbi:MAG: hypothetical protein H6926_03775 [Chromatiales bacterium]|nr:hypothetical protein [Gammaproteobacteria bacterium]MCP5352295.1 hypothetical protein [Chromatiales bacterium]